MEKILFRGQARKFGEKVRVSDGKPLPGHWVYGGVLQGTGDHSIIYGGEDVNAIANTLDKWSVYTDTLGFYTGETDKNGQMIFEGDILLLDMYGVAYVGVVTYRDALFGVSTGTASPALYEAVRSFRCEVIGNIHDNPTLYEKERARNGLIAYDKRRGQDV